MPKEIAALGIKRIRSTLGGEVAPGERVWDAETQRVRTVEEIPSSGGLLGFRSTGTYTGPMHRNTVLPMLCSADVLGTFFAGDGTVLNHGRAKRLFTHHQMMALRARGGGCAIPGCPVPAVDCQIHHLDPWSAGGCTDINRAELVCKCHHDELHEGTWRIIDNDTGRWYQPAPWLNPRQPLLTNTYWQNTTQHKAA